MLVVIPRVTPHFHTQPLIPFHSTGVPAYWLQNLHALTLPCLAYLINWNSTGCNRRPSVHKVRNIQLFNIQKLQPTQKLKYEYNELLHCMHCFIPLPKYMITNLRKRRRRIFQLKHRIYILMLVPCLLSHDQLYYSNLLRSKIVN